MKHSGPKLSRKLLILLISRASVGSANDFNSLTAVMASRRPVLGSFWGISDAEKRRPPALIGGRIVVGCVGGNRPLVWRAPPAWGIKTTSLTRPCHLRSPSTGSANQKGHGSCDKVGTAAALWVMELQNEQNNPALI